MIFKLFSYFKNNDYNFCIINGYKDIIDQIDTESDIDILLKQEEFKNIEEILEVFCIKENLKIVQVLHHDLWAKNIFLFNPLNGEYLNLDLYGELSRKEIIFFNEEDIFNSLDMYENIPILSSEKEFINYLIKKLDKDDLTEENFVHLRYLFLKSEMKCKNALIEFFPTKYNLLVEVFQNDNFKDMQKYRNEVILNFYRSIKKSKKRKILNIFRTIKRILNPTGLTISFLGPDGSGKSTIIDTILEKRLPFRRDDYFHLKPVIAKKVSLSDEMVTDPHKYAPYSPLKSYIKLLYFIYQYNFGWIKNILKLKIKSSLVIFDRYFDDMLVDYKRYRYGGSLKIAKFIRYFISKPDLYFILIADPDVIYKRKQEVPFEELERQVKKYRELADGKRYFSIDVNRNPQEISKEIITIMMEKMNERY